MTDTAFLVLPLLIFAAWLVATSAAVSPGLQTRHQQQIDYLDGPVGQPHSDGAPRRNYGQDLRVFDRQRATIRQVNLKWLKRHSPMHFPELFDGHSFSISKTKGESTCEYFVRCANFQRCN